MKVLLLIMTLMINPVSALAFGKSEKEISKEKAKERIAQHLKDNPNNDLWLQRAGVSFR